MYQTVVLQDSSQYYKNLITYIMLIKYAFIVSVL